MKIIGRMYLKIFRFLKNMNQETKVVILCGGRGTRINEETAFKPKPLIPIGGMPILWHIMKTYSHYGCKDFILCLGYKGEMIKDFFINFEWKFRDIALNMKNGREFKAEGISEDWNITFADTGLESLTGERLKKVEKYLKGDDFFVTYGDGLADINVKELFEFHKKTGKTATLTAVNTPSRFGILDIAEGGIVRSFREKPRTSDFINGGFFVFKNEIFNHLEGNTMFEHTTLPKLARDSQLAAFKHESFWQCMDTYRDFERLNKLWNSGEVPWKKW